MNPLNGYSEVRCCCDPTKVLGFLPSPYPGHERLVFPVFEKESCTDVPMAAQFETITLEYTKFFVRRIGEIKPYVQGRAWKSNDYPIEKLRKIPGWLDVQTQGVNMDRFIIQQFPEELDYVNAQLHPLGKRPGGYLELFLHACLRAAPENYPKLQPILREYMASYPADEERLKMEQRDRGADTAMDILDNIDISEAER